MTNIATAIYSLRLSPLLGLLAGYFVEDVYLPF